MAYHPEPGDLDEMGWEPAPVKPLSALSPFERTCWRRDAFDHALETIQRRGGDPEALRPGFVAAFDPSSWPVVAQWLRKAL